MLIIDGELYQLNETAELVWSLCTGENTLEQIATQVAQDYHVDQRQAHADLSELFGELEAIGAIVLST